MNKSLLDTDILSEVMRGRNPQVMANATAYQHAYSRFTISVITVMEIVKGLEKAERQEALERFRDSLGQFEVLPLLVEQCVLAGQIYGKLERFGQTIGRADPMIAATALTHDLELVTGNTLHYSRLDTVGFSLHLANWREPMPPPE